MRSILSLFMIFSSCSFLFGQDYSLEFGKVNFDDFKYEYTADKDAEAVVLYDIGETRFDRGSDGYDLRFIRRTKIKILSNSAIDEYGEINIPIYKDNYQTEKVEKIKAITYNFENDQIIQTELKTSETFEEKLTENWYVKKFTMPNVRTGSVIEYQYTLTSPFKFNLQDWEFQSTIPTVYSKYTAKMIPFYEYVFLLQGANQFDEQKSYVSKGIARQYGPMTFQDNIHEYVMRNLPAFKDVDYITSTNDYIIKLDFQLAVVHTLNGANIDIMTTWPDLIKELVKDDEFGDFVKKSQKYVGKNIELSAAEGKSEMEKLEIGVNYVKANFSWDGFQGKYASKDLKEFLNEKTGNVGCINLFLTGVLRSMGIEAYPLILSTRSHGKIATTYPFSSFFNYVIVAAVVDGNTILTDATETLTPYYRIPTKCMNDKGLLVNEDDTKWFSLYPLFLSKTKKEFEIAVNERSDSLEVSFTNTSYEYDALHDRKIHAENKEKVDDLIESEGLLIKGNVNYENEITVEKPFVFSFSASRPAEMYNDKLYISPFLDEVVKENPFKQKERIYPVDIIYPKSRQFKSVINIPAGYKLQEKPKAFNYSNELAEINYLVSQANNNQVNIEAWYTLKKPIYEAKDYGKLRYCFLEIIKNFNQQIVLVKE